MLYSAKPRQSSHSPAGITWLTVALLALALLASDALAPVLSPVEGAGGNQGLQGGWAVDDAGNVDFDKSVYRNLSAMQDAGAGWVRINFRLGECFQTWTRRGCNGKTALQMYDQVIAEAQRRNLKVLGLLSNESWHGTQAQWTASNGETTAGNGDNPYVRAFAKSAAGVLAGHYASKVPAWEVWNEPNAWTSLDASGNPVGGTFIYPSNFAWLLKRSYEAIKSVDPGMVVIAGGLFGHDIGGASVTVIEDGRFTPATKRGEAVGGARGPGRSAESTALACPTSLPSGADYLCATYEKGITKAKWRSGNYPFDHMGQHLYIDQGGSTSSEKISAYLQDLRAAYLLYEGAGTPKQTHLTEFGWQTPTGGLGEATQANNLKVAYNTFRGTAYVGRAYWFSIQDVPAAFLYFGLLRDNGTMKPAFAAYQTAAAY